MCHAHAPIAQWHAKDPTNEVSNVGYMLASVYICKETVNVEKHARHGALGALQCLQEARQCLIIAPSPRHAVTRLEGTCRILMVGTVCALSCLAQIKGV